MNKEEARKKVGNYIHYKRRSYLIYGTDFPTSNMTSMKQNHESFDFKTEEQNIINHILGERNSDQTLKKTAQAYEELLNQFFHPGGNSGAKSDNKTNLNQIAEAQVQAIIDAVDKVLNAKDKVNSELGLINSTENKTYDQILKSVRGVFGRKPTYKLAGDGPGKHAYREVREEDFKRQYEYLSIIREKIKQINEKGDALEKKAVQELFDGCSSMGLYKDFEGWFESLEVVYKSLYDENTGALPDVYLKKSKKENGLSRIHFNGTDMHLGHYHILKEMDDTIKYIFSTRNNSTIHGEYAEYVVAAMLWVIQNGIKSTGDQLVNELLTQFSQSEMSGNKSNVSLVGRNKSSTALSSKNIDSNLLQVICEEVNANRSKEGKNKQTLAKSVEGIDYLYVNATQGKVDVTVNINERLDPLSIKNYNFPGSRGYGLHLLSGASTLALIQDCNTTAVNHALNILTEHEDSSFQSQDIQNAHRYIKLCIVAKALAGGVLRGQGKKNESTGEATFTENPVKDAAQFFVVNDNSQGRFYVTPMSTLFNQLIKEINTPDNNYLNRIKTGDFDGIKQGSLLENKWQGVKGRDSRTAALARIGHILAILHQQKLEVSIPLNLYKVSAGIG